MLRITSRTSQLTQRKCRDRGVPSTSTLATGLLYRAKKKFVLVLHARRYAGESVGAVTPGDDKGFLSKFFRRDKLVAKPGFNRWLLVPGAVATHLALGSTYGWSLMNEPLSRELGVVASAAGDWNLSSVVLVFSIVLGMHGLSAAVLGKWQERVGPRVSGVLGAITFGGGMVIGGLGVMFHQLWMLYLGYGVLSGIGMGLAYVPPVATLIRWFPDKRGLATGLTIMGFGGGAFVCSPIIQKLFQTFQKAPTYLGKIDDVQLITEHGKRFVSMVVDGITQLKEVVIVTQADIKSSSFPDLLEGVYLVGTGSTGSTETLIALGCVFFSTMLLSALSFKIPYPGYIPAGWTPPPPPAGSSVSASSYVHIDNVMKTPQFWQLWVTFGCVATAGMGVLSMAKTMMREIFSSNLPHIVTHNFAATYIMALSVGNLLGRLVWAALSDKIGRKKTFALFTLASIPLYAVIPYCVDALCSDPTVAPLAVFYISTCFIVSFFGGIYAVCPPYESDLFGSKFVGAVHGRMLTASAFAALCGPIATTFLRKQSEMNAIKDLCTKIDPTVFFNRFGAPLSELDKLIEAKTVTINKLLTMLPPDTIDPTPFIYNTSLYGAVGLVVLATFVNFSIRPVNAKHFTKDPVPEVAKIELGHKWLIAVDGREISDHVFYWTISSLKKQQKIEKLLVIIVDPPVPSGSNTALTAPYLPTSDGEPHFESARILAKYTAAAKQLGVNVIPLLVTSTSIAEGILTVAELQNPELIIVPGEKAHEHKLGNFLRERSKCKVEIVELDSPVPEKDQLKTEAAKAVVQGHLDELLFPVPGGSNGSVSVYGQKSDL